MHCWPQLHFCAQQNFSTMRLFYFALLLSLSACGQQSDSKKHSIHPEALKLNDSAILVATYQQDYATAIKLLGRAIEIDSSFLTAYSNKLIFHVQLKQLDQALSTANYLTRRRPHNPDYYVTIGMLQEMKGDTISSKKSFN